MSTQRVPDEFVPTLTRLAQLSQPEFDALRASADELGGSTDISQLTTHLRASMPLEPDEFRALFDAVVSLNVFADTRSESLDTLVEEVAASLDLTLTKPERSELASRIVALASIEPIRVVRKGSALSMQHERLFLASRIMTDIRPVFGADPTEGLEAAILSHTLIIDFVSDRSADSFYIALDGPDLRHLQGVIQRAIDKESCLAQTLKDAGISNLSLEA